MNNPTTSRGEKIASLMSTWSTRMNTYSTMHSTDKSLLSIMEGIMKEQKRLSCERGFWWHIKAAFISLIYKLP